MARSEQQQLPIYLAHVRKEIVHSVPASGKADDLRDKWCRHCRTRHSVWWNLPRSEFPDRAVLCGHCERVSVVRLMTEDPPPDDDPPMAA